MFTIIDDWTVSQKSFHNFTRHWYVRLAGLSLLGSSLPFLKHWQHPIGWDLSRVPRLLKKNDAEGSCDNFGQAHQYPEINPVRLHRFMCIQLEQLLLNKFRGSWEFIIPSVLVFQHRSPGTWVTTRVLVLKTEAKKALNTLNTLSVSLFVMRLTLSIRTSLFLLSVSVQFLFFLNFIWSLFTHETLSVYKQQSWEGICPRWVP